jgi:ribA/ribD-fused uncharacterized protein
MIPEFKGEYAFLSNFYQSPIRWGVVRYPTAEHAFQAMKIPALRRPSEMSDPAAMSRERIARLPTAREAKLAGRKVALPPGWEAVKKRVMARVVLAKFEQNRGLAGRLDATGNCQLVEGNTWGDDYWGQVNGVGHNHLGRILMFVRYVLREDEDAAVTLDPGTTREAARS